MPKVREPRNNQNIPLPPGWELAQDLESGRIFYVDHINRKTQWIDPRERFVKPLTFADCIGDELPYGWEVAFDPNIGVYYIDHLRKKNQLEDPRIEWRNMQINMLNNYLQQASCDELITQTNNVTNIYNPTQTINYSNDSSNCHSINQQMNLISSSTSIQSENENRIIFSNSHIDSNIHHPSAAAAATTAVTSLAATNKIIHLSKYYDKEHLERSLAESKARVAQLKRELDANYNLLAIIDKYYKKSNSDANAVEV